MKRRTIRVLAVGPLVAMLFAMSAVAADTRRSGTGR